MEIVADKLRIIAVFDGVNADIEQNGFGDRTVVSEIEVSSENCAIA